MKNTGTFIGGIVAGAAMGAVTALLFAPQKGSDTRKQVKEKLNELEKELNHTKEKMKEKGGELKVELKEKIHTLEGKIEKLLAEYKKVIEPNSKTASVN